MSLLEDLVQQIQTQLAADGVQYSPPLPKDGPVVFLARYYEYNARRIAKKPRKTMISTERKASAAWSAHEPALRNLIAIIESGGDVGPYQTKRLEAFDLHDFLFSDWAIHHLHLGALAAGAQFATRTGDLLFVTTLEDRAHLIAVMNHHSFSELELLEIVEGNWPDYLDQFTLKGIEPTQVLTSHEIAELRSGGINPIIQLRSGRALMGPGGGIMISGVHTWSMTDAQATSRLLKQAEGVIQEKDGDFRNQLGIDGSARIRLVALEERRIVIGADDSSKTLAIGIG